ncbi:hypothetical protein GON03_19685 [Nocardioides sp. MAH-18]|uniref:GAP family protein n=1 Tax=Nocardioides agri TaxID=2682843 RepID=A0A6L6XXJ4_9ACTN|nr:MULTISPECIES: GAP family protein [unclassified Nocardioides]MBA2952245.1 GAP family protein [Nocardioides sp. CGMCC 1.13656]MVQ51407.1 hypothetical protein [Nocardioides sp. MAH-18]
MLRVLAVVLPLALVGAVSPVMLSEQTLLLSRRNGRRVAASYAGGVAGVLLVFVSALVLFGRSVSLPHEPSLSATLDVVLGCLLLALAVVLLARQHRPRREKRPHQRDLSPPAALGFGVFSMATNFTTLAILVPAAKEISASGLDAAARAVLILVVVVVAALPAWLPLALTVIAPGPASRGLTVLADLIAKRGALLAVLLLTALGLFLVARGAVHLL